MPTKKMSSSSNWAEVNSVRWREGQLTPMGGQAQLFQPSGSPGAYQFASRCKKIHGFFGLDGVYHIAYLCETNLYVDTGGTLVDISPTPPLAAPAGLVGGYGDGLYDVDLYGTPRAEPSSVAITKVPDAYSLDNFGSILYAMTSADGRLLMWDPGQGVPGNVANLKTTAAFVTTSPNITMVANPGAVTPGMSVFDTTTNKPVGTVLTYTGTALVLTANAANAGASGDTLAFGNVAVVQPPSSGRGPVPNGRCFVITQERFLMIFGSVNDGTAGGTSGGGPRRLAWCDQENPGAWDYSNVTSQAGFLDIEPASPIICADASRTGVIFWTAKKVYASRFLGLPYVYNAAELADATTPWSPQSVVTTSALTLWMSEQGVFSYDGTSVLPVACPIRPWVDDGIDPVAVRELSFAMHLGEWNEWWWFFPTLNSPFNTRAAVYNYKEGWWTQCRLSRSAGITSSYTAHPICADDFVAFQHEVGSAYANASMPVVLPFAESYDLNLDERRAAHHGQAAHTRCRSRRRRRRRLHRCGDLQSQILDVLPELAQRRSAGIAGVRQRPAGSHGRLCRLPRHRPRSSAQDRRGRRRHPAVHHWAVANRCRGPVGIDDGSIAANRRLAATAARFALDAGRVDDAVPVPAHLQLVVPQRFRRQDQRHDGAAGADVAGL